MSEFSESFHLRAKKQQEAIDLLMRAERGGVVFKPTNNWVTLVPEGDIHEAVEPLRIANHGILLHLIFAEDQGWNFSLYKKHKRICYYGCSWDSELIVDTHETDVSVLKKLTKDPLSIPKIEGILHPVAYRDIVGIDHRFAQLLGLEYYERLVGRDIERIRCEYEDQLTVVHHKLHVKETSDYYKWRDLQNKSRECYSQKRYSKALDYAQKAFDIAQKVNANEGDIIRVVLLQAKIFRSLKQYQKACNVLDNAIESICNLDSKDQYIFLLHILLDLSETLLMQEQYDKAKAISQKLCIAVQNPIDNRSALYGFNTLLKLAELYETIERVNEAEIVYEDALKFSEHPLLAGERRVIRGWDQILRFYEGNHQMDKAKMLQQKVHISLEKH